MKEIQLWISNNIDLIEEKWKPKKIGGEFKELVIITYQWYHGNGTRIEGATSASYNVPPNLFAGNYSYTAM